MATTMTVESEGVAARADEGKPRRYYKAANTSLENIPPGISNLHDNLLGGARIAGGHSGLPFAPSTQRTPAASDCSRDQPFQRPWLPLPLPPNSISAIFTTRAFTGDSPFLGTRAVVNGVAGPYVWQTYNQVYKRVKDLGSGLAKRNLPMETNIGLFSINRAEWVIAEHACYMMGWSTVPLYDTLGEEAIDYILNLTDLPIVVASLDKVGTLISIAPKIKSLKTIISMDTPDSELVAKASAAGIELISFVDIERQGAESPCEPAKVTKDNIATICFTSGTTGLPKGVVLSHENILSFVAAVRVGLANKSFYPLSREDSHISYLPLAHVFERIIQAAMVYVGGKVGFFQGDTLKLIDDVAELKPTVFASVPRLYNRIYDGIQKKIKSAGAISQMLFKFAYDAKKKHLAHGHLTHMIWDMIVFSKIRQRLGGRVKWMLCGAAPISPDVVDFMRICFSAQFTEGYGQTETTGAATTTVIEDLSSGHVGVPLGNCEVKLVDVSGLGYTSQDKPYPRGEVCIRGSNVFKGYYKAPEKTAETLDADGWCHTGDIGMWDSQGRLKVIDRVKHIFKLSQGEYVAPEKIEVVYQKHELVAQAFVHGNSLQSATVGIIVPDQEVLTAWGEKNGHKGKTFAVLCGDKDVKKAIVNILTSYGKENDLKGFECVKLVHLEPTPFSPENGMLSPTFKLKRHEAQKYYAKQIDEMYAEINKQGTA